MKILYVEDELSKNIPKIIQLFSKYLGDENIKELKTLEEDKYGGSPEEIKKIVEKSNLIEVEYRFPGGLKKIINNYKQYALFVIDRNLSNVEYDYDEIVAIDPNYNEVLYDKYFEREGDYFLQKLVYAKIDVMTKFYFLTGFAKSELRNADEIKTHIDFGKFTYQNIIEKGKSKEDEKNLINIINNIKILKLHWENREYLEILRNRIGEKAPYNFINLLDSKDSNESVVISKNLGLIRNILENILTIIANNQNAPEICFNKRNKKQIVIRNIIRWINDYNKERDCKIYRLGSSSIIKNFLYDIQEIASDFGAHENLEDKKVKPKPSSYQPTANSVNALIYDLKDIILWFNKIS